MLASLVEHSIRFRWVVVALACLTTAYGVFVIQHARFDVYPEFAPPQVVVQTEAPGLSPEDVEQLVTRPLENALNGAPSLESLRSQSVQGLSIVTALFHGDMDAFRARQIVNERIIEAAGQLPHGVEAPVMAPLTGATSLVLVIAVASDRRSPMELRAFAEWTLRPRLLAVPGVARVSLYGGETKRLEIQAVPERLEAAGLSLTDLTAAARTTSGIRGAGFVETPAQRIVLQTRGQSATPQQLAQSSVSSANGRAVRLQDVARVVEAPAPKIGEAAIMGRAGVLLLISSQYGANTVEVTRELEKALEEMKPVIADGQIDLYPDVFRPARFVMTSVRSVGIALLVGGVLVSVVLLLFLLNLRVAFISFTAIPLSLLAATIVLHHAGESLNTLTMGGLAIAIGEVVDDAIIDAENIFRRLREARRPFAAGELFRIVRDASIEVRSAVVYATLIVALVFLPVLHMSGIQGRLFTPLALTYILAIMASLLVALTLTPALSYLLLPGVAAGAVEPRYVHALKSRYARVLRPLTRYPRTVIAAAAILGVLALGATRFLGGSFLPELREGHFIVHMAALPGTSLAESMRLGKRVSAELLKNSEIRSVAQQVGRAESGDDTSGTHYSEFYVDLKAIEGERVETAERQIRETVAKFPGASFSANTFLTERIEEILSGTHAPVVVKVFGENLDAIDSSARDVAQVLRGVRGSADVRVEAPPGTPEMTVRLRPERLLQFGFQGLEVLEAVQTAYQGATVGQAYDGNRVVDIVVVLPPDLRERPEAVERLLLRSQSGVRVPLRALADVYESSGRSSIQHDETRRVQSVTCDVRGRDLASFVEEARAAIRNKVRLPAGSHAVLTGESEARRQAQREIVLYSLVAAVGIMLLLAIVFRNARNTLLVLANLPFALVGGVAAAFLTGGEVSVGSMVGFVTLFGISTRNSIMMMSHFEHLVAREGETWGLEAAIRGASERLNPVLMTALVTALGLLPLALGSGEPGKEIDGPMAVIILGGLVTSTALNLLVLPSLALRYGRFERAQEEA